MVLPILAYGHSILKQTCQSIDSNYPELNTLIADMWETMQHAYGCGLAAPQIGLPIRVFIVDSKSTFEKLNSVERKHYFGLDEEGIRETFINATITARSEDHWDDEEGCLSIPGITHPIQRPWSIAITYYNANFELQTRTFSGITARMIQHEYDHIEGVLWLDYLSPLSKKLYGRKLHKIMQGKIKTKYPMKFVEKS